MSKMASATPLAAPQVNGSNDANLITNGNHILSQEPRPPPAPPVAPAGVPSANNKKGGGKAAKKMDSSETSKLLAQRISQLEHDAAGEKDQEAEIGACLLSSPLSPQARSRGPSEAHPKLGQVKEETW